MENLALNLALNLAEPSPFYYSRRKRRKLPRLRRPATTDHHELPLRHAQRAYRGVVSPLCSCRKEMGGHERARARQRAPVGPSFDPPPLPLAHLIY